MQRILAAIVPALALLSAPAGAQQGKKADSAPARQTSRALTTVERAVIAREVRTATGSAAIAWQPVTLKERGRVTDYCARLTLSGEGRRPPSHLFYVQLGKDKEGRFTRAFFRLHDDGTVVKRLAATEICRMYGYDVVDVPPPAQPQPRR